MINIVSSLDELKSQLLEVLDSSGFELNRIDFAQQDAWSIRDGIMSHKSGGYFHVIGVRDSKTQMENLFFFQPQSAITGVLLNVVDNNIYVLVQARIEPGNTGVLQLGPAIQSTPANFLQMHGGKSTPYLNYFYSAQKNVIGFNSSNQVDVGKLFYQKTKLLNFAQVNDFVETEYSFVWAPLYVLLEAAKTDYLVNTDLRSLLGVYDWDALLGYPSKIDFTPSKILAYYLKKRTAINCSNNFVPLDETDRFCITNNSIYAEHEKDSEVGLYAIRTQHREVSEWIQPLWKAKTKGKVLLLCRNWDSEEGLELLLTVKKERGISGNFIISPSLLIYPNENTSEDLFDKGEILREFYQSDEGGRFINHEYLFRVSKVNESIQIKENQFWVNFRELKNILSMHNMANIHLRNICSVIIDKLNPNSF